MDGQKHQGTQKISNADFLKYLKKHLCIKRILIGALSWQKKSGSTPHNSDPEYAPIH